MLHHYAVATPYLFTFWGDDGWVKKAILADDSSSPWAQSVLFYVTAPWQLLAFHAIFLFSCAAFMLGWRTSWVKWFVLIGEISDGHRNEVITHGVNAILCCLLVILCVAPIG